MRKAVCIVWCVPGAAFEKAGRLATTIVALLGALSGGIERKRDHGGAGASATKGEGKAQKEAGRALRLGSET
jgi:hypothetical protein